MLSYSRTRRAIVLALTVLGSTLVTTGCAEGASPPSTTESAGTGIAGKAQARGLGSSLPQRLPQSSGSGGTFYVDAVTGSDAGSGTSKSPWRTISKALASVPLNGSIVKVRPGTYTSTGASYAIVFNRKASSSDPVTLIAEQPGTVKIRNGDLDRSTLGAWIINASGLRVQGFDFLITAHQRNISANAALVENSDRIEFVANRFQENGGFQVRGGKTDGEVAEDVWLLGNTFRPSGDDVFAQATGNSHKPDTYAGSKGSHYVYAGQVGDVSKGFSYRSGTERLVVANNVFAGTAAGRHVELGPQARSSIVTNNTFFGNRAGSVIGWNTGAAYAGEGVVLYANTDSGVPAANRDNVVVNNIFASLDGHSVFGSGPSQAGNVVERNLSWDIVNGKGQNGDVTDDYAERYGSSILFGEGRGNLVRSDPRLVAPRDFDFRVGDGSPAIGAADPAYAVAFDHAGRNRDAQPDLGALEHGTHPLPAGADGGNSTLVGSPGLRPGKSHDATRTVRPRLHRAPRVRLSQRRDGTYVLRCDRGTWSGTGPVRFSYRWARTVGRRQRPVDGASRATYRLSRADRGSRLTCVVIARNRVGTRVARSSSTARIRRHVAAPRTRH